MAPFTTSTPFPEGSYKFTGAFVNDPPFTKNYGSSFLVFEKGKGSWLWDREGKKYLDFGSGIAVNSFGHGRGDFAAIVAKQMKTLVHTSNLFTTMPTLELARKLVASSPLAKDQPYRSEKPAGYFAGVHLGNSGSEANETALKYARIYASRKAQPNGTRILAFENSFHGRTMGALSCTWTEKYRLPSAPLVPGVSFIPFNDIQALESILSSEFCAVIVEPIQGEGGLCPMTEAFAQRLNELCRAFDVCLIADEIQTGLGRTGTLFASQALGLQPDIISLAKPLAGGLPASATLVVPKIHEVIHAGDHGGTFGGNPVACALGNAVWDEVSTAGFLGSVNELSTRLRRGLDTLRSKHPCLGPERGKGMLIGIEILGKDGKPASSDDLARLLVNAREEGLIVLRSGSNVLRMAPPLNISPKDADEGLKRLGRALKRFESYKPA